MSCQDQKLIFRNQQLLISKIQPKLRMIDLSLELILQLRSWIISISVSHYYYYTNLPKLTRLIISFYRYDATLTRLDTADSGFVSYLYGWQFENQGRGASIIWLTFAAEVLLGVMRYNLAILACTIDNFSLSSPLPSSFFLFNLLGVRQNYVSISKNLCLLLSMRSPFVLKGATFILFLFQSYQKQIFLQISLFQRQFLNFACLAEVGQLGLRVYQLRGTLASVGYNFSKWEGQRSLMLYFLVYCGQMCYLLRIELLLLLEQQTLGASIWRDKRGGTSLVGQNCIFLYCSYSSCSFMYLFLGVKLSYLLRFEGVWF